jgi:hypothetical protein
LIPLIFWISVLKKYAFQQRKDSTASSKVL